MRKGILIPVAVAVMVVAAACGGSTTTGDSSGGPGTAAVTFTPTATAQPQVTPTEAAQTSPQDSSRWEIVDVDDGTKPALALDSQGTPHIAYMLESNRGFVKEAVLNGGAWDVALVAEGYFYGPLDLAIGPDDVPHIAYQDHQALSFNPSLGDAVHAFFANGVWELDIAADGGHDGWDNRIIVDAEGKVHMSGIDPVDFNGDGVEYYYQDDSGQWQVEEVGSGPQTYTFATSIGVGPQGEPYIGFYDQKSKDLKLATKEGSDWIISTVDADGDTGLFSSMAIEGDGRIHITYIEKTGSASGIVKYATRGPAEDGWQITEIGTLSSIRFGFTGARNITSVALDSQGNPWVAFSDEDVLTLAKWDGSQWSAETVAQAGARSLGQLVSLMLDDDDGPHIAYFEVVSANPLSGVIKYAYIAQGE